MSPEEEQDLQEFLDDVEDMIDIQYPDAPTNRRDVIRATLVAAEEITAVANFVPEILKGQTPSRTELFFRLYGADVAGASVIMLAISDKEEEIHRALQLLALPTTIH